MIMRVNCDPESCDPGAIGGVAIAWLRSAAVPKVYPNGSCAVGRNP